jgi:O-antigen/teichoic acid export membrane protein
VETAAVSGAPAEPDLPRASLGRNASVLTASMVVARLTMFALGIVLARGLGAESYGRYALAVALGAVLMPVADIGITTYLGREIARDRLATEAALPLLARVKAILLVATVALTAGVAAPVVHDPGTRGVIDFVVLAALLDGSSAMVYGYFRGRETMGYEATATTVAALVRGVGGIALVVAFHRLWPVVAWVVLVAVGQLVFALSRLRSAAPRARSRGIAVHVDWISVASMGLYSLFVIVYLRIDSVMIGWLLDERAVGVYAAAYTLMLGAQIAPTMLAAALTPVFARSHRRDDAAFRSAWASGIRLVVLISLPIALVVSALSGPIIARLYGQDYASAGNVLALVIWVSPLGSLSLVIQAVLRGARHERRLTIVAGVCALANVAANLWAIQAHGIIGASVTTIVTEALNVALLLWLVLREGLVPPPRFPVARLILASAALVGVARLMIGLPVELAGAAALVAFVAVLAATRVITAADVPPAVRRVLGRSD